MDHRTFFRNAHRQARYLRNQCVFVRSYRSCLSQAMREGYEVVREEKAQVAARVAMAVEDEAFRAAHPELVQKVAQLRDQATVGGLVVDPKGYSTATLLYTIAREAWVESRA